MKIQTKKDRAKQELMRVPNFGTICYKLLRNFHKSADTNDSMTTCIDTIEIYYPLSHYEAGYVAYQLDAMTHATDEGKRKRFLSIDFDDKDNVRELVYDRFYRYITGITRIKLLKLREKWVVNRTSYRFKIYIWLKPELLVTGRYSLQLFRCSPLNYHALQEAYGYAIWRMFPRSFDYAPLDVQLEAYEDYPPSGAYTNQNLSRLPYLGLCRIERLDITKDIVVADPSRFEELVRKSYQDNQQLKVKKKEYLLAESRANALKAYDKYKELSEQHTHSPDLPQLLQQASGVVRIELSIKKPDRETLNKLFNLCIPAASRSAPSYLLCGLIPFLFNDYGDSLFYKVWQAHIGSVPWVSKYHVNQAIDKSHAWQETKKLAKDVSYVISHKRSLNEAKDAFVKGVTIHGKEIKGTVDGFDKAVKFIKKLGVQPFRIPGRWNIARIEADYRMYPSVNEGSDHLTQIRPGIPSASAEIYETIKTKLKEIYESYKLL